MFFCILVSVSYFTDDKGILFIIPVSLLLIIYLVFLFRKKYTFRYRNILELAAKPVNDTSDGFTPRPFPVGKSKYTKDDLTGFGKFLSENLIAFPYIDAKGLILVINSSGKFWFQKPKLNKDTYIVFDYNGSVSVNITKKDYNRYNEELTFDQLCTSLGELFKRFLKYYLNN